MSSWVSGVIGSSQVASLCARIVRAESRADDLFTADQKICTGAPLLEIRNQATLRHWIAGNGRCHSDMGIPAFWASPFPYP